MPPSSLQTACLCLLGTSPNLYCYHLWFQTQTLHLSRRTRIYLYARYLQCLVGTWQETLVFVQHYTTHLMIPCLKLVSRSNLALTSFTCGWQKSSYLALIISKQRSSVGKHQEIYWSIPKSPLHTMTFLHFFDSGNIASSQSRIEYSHTSASTLRIAGTSDHLLSNPSWALQYKAWTWVAQIVLHL